MGLTPWFHRGAEAILRAHHGQRLDTGDHRRARGQPRHALAKFIASWISGSTAMLTEAIHSIVDAGDQVLLLVGQKRGARPPDARHPLGHGMETYFWSFIVALMVFLLGGVLSLYEGVRHILKPEPVISPWISIAVLAIAAVFEGTSFRIAYREYRRVVRGRPTRQWDFIKASKDPALFSVLLEDSAALIGICFAAAGVIAATFFQVTWADGIASIAIGLLLASVAFLLANETRSLIAGEAVARRSSWSDCERLYLGSVASPASTRWRLCILVPARF